MVEIHATAFKMLHILTPFFLAQCPHSSKLVRLYDGSVGIEWILIGRALVVKITCIFMWNKKVRIRSKVDNYFKKRDEHTWPVRGKPQWERYRYSHAFCGATWAFFQSGSGVYMSDDFWKRNKHFEVRIYGMMKKLNSKSTSVGICLIKYSTNRVNTIRK